METTRWESYGTESGNRKCANCMVHSGYEASAVNHTFSSLGGLWATIKSIAFSGGYKDPDAEKMLDEVAASPDPVVQVSVRGQSVNQPQESGV